ncbi:hypothetical protein BU16DRAFT_531232 [Lophium mytilinum]|uniref:C2H2-type domain-containing protein n=1 Tax=Lophium mytilinum TaxID=390894 RepID=A0A6A6QCL8_9PEZI|nr:hypothetical protein BU16DRAFT_531232 [Lophium mytilinum]
MAIQGQRPQHSTSIYLTFKVFQLINQLRRRLKPRVQASSAETLDEIVGAKRAGIRATVEDVTFSRLEKSLPHQAKHRHRDRVAKPQKRGSRVKPLPLGKHASGGASTHEEEVQRMLRDLESPNSALQLSQVAANQKQFLNRNTEPNFDIFPLQVLICRLAEVQDAIEVLYLARAQYDDKWLICQGNELGLAIDEVFIANYEHLLLSLRGQLMQAIVRKVLERAKGGSHDEYGKKQRRLLSWFSEFPDCHRPLSTTWPWSIKPSLAVLWGVCWMFYYPNGTQPNPIASSGAEYDNLGVPQNYFLNDDESARQFMGWSTRPPQPDEYVQFGRQMMQQAGDGGRRGGRGSVGDVGARMRNAEGDLSSGHMTRRPSHNLHLNAAQPQYANPPSDPIGSAGFLAQFTGSTRQSQASPAAQYNNTYALSSHASSTTPAQAFPWPGNSGIATDDFLGPDVDAFANWNFTQPNATTQHSPVSPELPRQSLDGSHLTPTIRLTEPNGQAPDARRLAAPQVFLAASSIYDAGTPQAPLPQQNQHRQNISVHTNFPIYNNNNIMGHISQGSPHNMTPNTPNNTSILSPVSMGGERSPVSYHSPRRLSNAQSHASSHSRPRAESEEGSQSPEAAESTISPRRGGHAFKRAEEPPRNAANKMFCQHSDCATLNTTFDRKCEWSKHMDKHDRPYKCSVAGCEKLQGFTYSGGLLRHEREVHKMHGGTKKALFCPFPDCKRSSGQGFTRKENLAEHKRRVHRGVSGSSDLGTAFKAEAGERDDGDSPEELREEETQLESDLYASRKRKRSEVMPADIDDATDLNAEVKRLRRENEDFRRKNEDMAVRLRQLEEVVMRSQQQSQQHGPR